jgi:hypothetical protein
VLTVAFILFRRFKTRFHIRIHIKHPAVVALLTVILLLPPVIAVIKYRQYGQPIIKYMTTYTNPGIYRNPSFNKEYPQFKSNLAKNVLSFPFRIKDLGFYTPYNPDMQAKSGFGVQFFGFGLLAYGVGLFMWVYKKEFRYSIMGFLTAFGLMLLLAYFIIYFTWANYRSFLFFAVIGLMLWAYFQEKWQFKPYQHKFVDLLIVVMVVFNITACFFEGNLSGEQWKTTLTMENHYQRNTINYASLVNQNPGPGNSWNYIDQFIPPDQAIGFSGGTDAWTFPYYDNKLQRRIYFIDRLPGFRVKREKRNDTVYRRLIVTDKFLKALKERDIRYIHLSTQGTTHRDKLYIPFNHPAFRYISSHLYYVYP